MGPSYNDRLCNKCKHRVRYRGKMGVRFGCNLINCNYETKKSSHVSPVEFIPDAGVLIVRTRHYSQVSEIILAHRDEDGRMFKEEKEVKPAFVDNPNYSPFDGSQSEKAICPACGYSSVYKLRKYCPNCGVKFLETSGGE